MSRLSPYIVSGGIVSGGIVSVGMALCAAASPALFAQQAKPWQQIPVPKLHAFRPQQPKRIELKNGIVVFLQEDHELPFISGNVLIPGGSRNEDPSKTGLVGLYGQAWRTSGTAAMNGDATLQVALRTPIPVLIVYATAVVPDTGEVLFLDDIYKQDAQLEKLLAASRPAL